MSVLKVCLFRVSPSSKEVVARVLAVGWIVSLVCPVLVAAQSVEETERSGTDVVQQILSDAPGYLREDVAVVEPGTAHSTPPPRVMIEAVITADTTIRSPDSVHLPPSGRDLTFRYAGLHVATPEATTFRTELHGLEATPTRTPRRSVRYTNLPPGTYTFAVQALGEQGTWSEPVTLTLTVAPYWWETSWFYAGCVLLVVGCGAVGYRWHVRRLRKQQRRLEAAVEARTDALRKKNEQLTRQAQRLQELDEAKSRFFANLSHEFRTPLTLIRGPVRKVCEHLRRDDVEPDEDTERLEIAERNTARLQRLIEQILGLARMDAGTYELAARPLELGPAVTRIGRSFEPMAERQRLTLTVETETLPDHADPAYVDREALEYVLSNLLSNAIKFTPNGGRVDVIVREAEDAAELVVRDTGIGIPENDLKTIFERFQQSHAHSESTRPQEGAGIGLAFVRDLVELHGGTIAVDSVEGKGTTVTVCFLRGDDHLRDDQVAEPLSSGGGRTDDEAVRTGASLENPSPVSGSNEPTECEAAPDSASVPEASFLSGSAETTNGSSNVQDAESKIVLVVDDNADVRQYVRSILEPEFAIMEADCGEEGLEQAREALPDVILADVIMPGMDGYTMVRQLRDDAATTSIPVVMVTARADAGDEVEGLQAGADDYLTKPFDPAVLKQRIHGVIATRERLRKQLQQTTAAPSAPTAASEDLPRGTDTAEAAPSPIEREVRRVIRQHLTDASFNVAHLASEMAMSRSTLYRKLKDEADVTPSTLITQVRLEQAQVLLEDGEDVTRVAYAVGYGTLSAFSTIFRKHVGTTPSTYAARR